MVPPKGLPEQLLNPLVLLALLTFPALSARAGKLPLTRCPGLRYQKGQCGCLEKAAEPCEKCPCTPCSGDAECACAEALTGSSGTLTGTLDLHKTRVRTEGQKNDADVIVYLKEVGGNDFPQPLHHPVMDQKNRRFMPHVMAVRRGSRVEFHNSDDEKHNVYFLFDSTAKTKDLGTWPPGKKKDYQFDNADTAITLCKLHLNMEGYLVVVPNPYFTQVQLTGSGRPADFTIENIPPGRYEVATWHKELKLKTGNQTVEISEGNATRVELLLAK